MSKLALRKEFFRLRVKGHSYNQCRRLLKSVFGFEVSVRTLKRWSQRLDSGDWDLMDKSRRPKVIHYKMNKLIEGRIIKLRKETGWGANKIKEFISEVSESTIKRVLSINKLTEPRQVARKRIKYIRWQREHPNSLWQLDLSDQKITDHYCLGVIDDCSRYCLGVFALKKTSTSIVTHLLDELISIHGKPRELLTDNGAVFGLRSKKSYFDKWCRRRSIKHIRTSIHSPTTTGKIERLFKTLKEELKYCQDDPERFRLRYNHYRPHISLKGKTPASKYFKW